MHELSLCQAMLETVERRAAGRRVHRVNVRIGQFRQVVPDSLQFAWELLTDGTDLAGSVLAIDHVPAVIECTGCGELTTLDWPAMACARCGGLDVRLIKGQELMIVSLDVAEGVP
jgi:hydrogenase nickel incorporation protein HypA/HybF